MLTDEQQNQLKDILRLIPPDEQAAFLDMLAHDLRGRALTVASCAASQNTHGANSFSTAGQCTVPEMWPNGSHLCRKLRRFSAAVATSIALTEFPRLGDDRRSLCLNRITEVVRR